MSINMQAIMSKVRAYEKSKRCAEKTKKYIRYCVENNIEKTCAGDTILTEKKMNELAEAMINILQSIAGAYNLPESVFDNIMSLTKDSLILEKADNKKDSYSIGLYFSDDLSRPSLLIVGGSRSGRTGEGISNIISLFDTGATIKTNREIRGIWDGHENLGEVSATLHRPELHFMRDAIQQFNTTYGTQYDVYAELPGVAYYAR